MTFLAQLAQAIVKGLQIVTGFAPFLAQNPHAAAGVAVAVSDLEHVAGVIQQVEVFGQMLQTPGVQKLAAATPAVAQVILQSAVLAGHKVQDQTLFTTGAEKIASGMADVLNSLHADGVQTTNMAA